MNILKLLTIFLFTSLIYIHANNLNKKIVYIIPDYTIPFWKIMVKGAKSEAALLNYEIKVLNSNNDSKIELQNTIQAIKEKVSGIIVTPTDSSACATILKLAKKANIPVVISDIGTDKGEYVSYISSNNEKGAYEIGKVLTKKMKELGLHKGKVGIIAIPQKRLNGQQRTAGFMKALDEASIKNADLKQHITWKDEETYNYIKEMIEKYPSLNAIWLQTSNFHNSAIKAIEDSNKDNILLIAFDAEPEFLDLIPKGKIIASGMQQPYLMGKSALIQLDKHLKGIQVQKDLHIPILIITTNNIKEKLSEIKLNVLGIKKEK